VRTVTLDEALSAAVASNLDYRSLEETSRQAELLLYRAWTALAPTLSADGSIVRNAKEISVGFPAAGAMPDPATGEMPMDEIVIQEKWGKRFGFTANMPIFNAQSIPGIQIARRNEAAATSTVNHLRHEILFRVAAAYYQASATAQMVSVYAQAVEITAAFHKQAEALTKAGQGTSIDVLRAEIEVRDAEKNLENAKDSHELALSALHYMTGLARPFEVSPPPARKEPGELSAITDKALRGREDLSAARTRIEMAEKTQTAVLLGWVPTFDVTYNWSWSSAAGFGGEKDTWMLIFGARWNLFDGGHRIVDNEQRKSEIAVAKNSMESLKLSVRQEVESQFITLRSSARNVALAAKQVELARQTHHQLSRQYDVGLATTLDVLTASSDLSNKRTTEVIEQLQRDIALLELSRAIGDYESLKTK
jgi:outer membrane protein TolC